MLYTLKEAGYPLEMSPEKYLEIYELKQELELLKYKNEPGS
jgi:hypothetical protein